ncbi:putative bzip transcription factor protein [Phaeoacremonium minimum UCRPA7]|uniref:Putative bzip transcription factor protein n=1 Tax=Phaeoacremonium minimum (strain UCR-PA7) TaxID=1286976 RepID=R8BLC7_PHAM7|nr:putative bzip transcription factor protein [Phaeoacremonium minimum UCRPA7]EOO00065.1 putative bzip transcription factor protein [Phaeoacremonium minimum UCRPA7]
MLDQQRHDLIHGLDLGAERLGLDFLLGPSQRVARIQNGTNGAQDSPGFNRTWAGAGQVMGSGFNQGSGMPRLDFATDALTPTSDNLAGYSAPIKNCPPTCPLDSLLLDFLQERRQRAAEGLSPQDIIGPKYPSVSSLLNPMSSRFSHPLSKVFTDILQTFPDLSRLPERVAVLYIMFLIMRWQISPTQENYDRLPEWMTPRPSQLFTPHPAWIDHLPFPRMREKLVRDYGPAEFPFENFFIPFTTTLSLNWPYEDTDTLLQSPDSDELLINPVFERHLRRLENWTLGDAFAKAFPGLADTYGLKSEGQERRR